MPTLTTVSTWTVIASGDTARFTHAYAGDFWAPRVWSGHGLAVAETDLAGLDETLKEMMKLPIYWLARGRHQDSRAGDAAVWSEPWFDSDDEFVYIGGPCRTDEPTVGYRPALDFAVDLVHLRGLRIRVAKYRTAPLRGSGVPVAAAARVRPRVASGRLPR